MNRSLEVSASILSADFTRLGDEVRRAEAAGADRIHVDVMDGHFVPNISIGQVIVQAVRRLTSLPIEAHLMIEHPGAYVEDFADKGADMIQIHVECYGERRSACRDYGQFPKEVDRIDEAALRTDLRKIRGKGKKAYVVVNPGTPFCFSPVLDEADGVLIMSVNPGFSNQKFITDVLSKARDIRKVFAGDMEIDGGVNAETAPAAVKAGINVLATASYLFGAKDLKTVVQGLKSLG